MAYYDKEYWSNVYDDFSPPITRYSPRPLTVDHVGRTNPGYMGRQDVKYVGQSGWSAKTRREERREAERRRRRRRLAICCAFLFCAAIVALAIALSIVFGLRFQQQTDPDGSTTSATMTAAGGTIHPDATTAESSTVAVACDPNCKSGCNEQGTNKCDTACKAGYELTANYTCVQLGCDPNCLSGCSEQGSNKCDIQCNFDYRLAANYTCVMIPCSELTPNVTGSVYIGGFVRPITVHLDEVFVLKDTPDYRSIVVYNASTLEFKRNLSVEDGPYARGFAASAQGNNNYLYMSSSSSSNVSKIKLPSGPVEIQWNVGKDPEGVAISNVQNVLVNVKLENKIKEYTPEGILVREVSVPPTFNLYDIKQLPSGEFLVSNDFSSGKMLAVVTAAGTVARFYNKTMLSYGSGFDVFRNGYVLAADFGNHRLLIVNPTLTEARVLAGLSMRQPLAVSIVESRGRAYVGEGGATDARRLLVIENIFGRCIAF